jgi:hypothetical protein
MFMRVVEVVAKPNFTLGLTFSDGTRGDISIKDRLFGPIFEPLQDPRFFAEVALDEFGAVCWPNGADLAPDGLYRMLVAC